MGTVITQLRKIDLLIILGLVASLSIVLGIRVESVSQQTEIVLHNQELIKNASNKAAIGAQYARDALDTILINQELIKRAVNQSAIHSEEMNKTQHGLLGVNENLLLVYQNLLVIEDTLLSKVMSMENNLDTQRQISRGILDTLKSDNSTLVPMK